MSRIEQRQRGPESADKRVDAAVSEVLRVLIPKLREAAIRGYYGKVGVSLTIHDGLFNHAQLHTEQSLKVLS